MYMAGGLLYVRKKISNNLLPLRHRLAFSSSSTQLQTENKSPPSIPPFDHVPKPYTGISGAEIMKKRKEFLGSSLFHYYKIPVNIVEGKMQYLYDENGRRYLDAIAGIVTVSCGHCHPNVVDAIVNQTKLLQHATTVYLHHAIAEYAEAMASKLPGDLKVVYFVNSGTEANELAMLMARLYTGTLSMVGLRNAYHGGSTGAMGLTALNTWKYPLPQGEIHHVVNPDPYHGSFGSDPLPYAKELQDHIHYGTAGHVAGFIAETFQGAGGAVELAPGYLKLAYEIIRKAGGVCIADEVQSGFGRTGTHYWGFETQDVIPDIVTMAKGIGNGLPLAAVVTTPEIANEDPTLPLTVDIGCGSGRFLLWFANKFSQSNNYLGFEIRKGLVDRANIWAMELGLQNIYFMFANATITFDQLVVSYPGPLIFVSILCPDPYFKKRHHKRRVLQSNLVESIARNLSPGGKVFIQSDVCEAAIEMRNRFDALFDVFEHVDVGGGDNDDDNCLCDGEGWVLSNPMGLRTEREIHAESKGGKIYRRLYFKKMERDSNENHVYENL